MAKISFVDVGNGGTSVTVPYPIETNYLPVRGIRLGIPWGAVDKASGELWTRPLGHATELGVRGSGGRYRMPLAALRRTRAFR